jgi:hypothetical protein
MGTERSGACPSSGQGQREGRAFPGAASRWTGCLPPGRPGASDNLDGSNTCEDVSGLVGICFLPYS